MDRAALIEMRRSFDPSRAVMCEGLSLGHYFLLANVTWRMLRDGKAATSSELAGILERLGCRSSLWADRMEKLRQGRWLGRFFAASRAKLMDLAGKLGVRHLVNLAGCPT